MGASATKSFARSRIFRYGLRNDILSRGQKTKARGGGVHCTAPPPPWFKGLNRRNTFYGCGATFNDNHVIQQPWNTLNNTYIDKREFTLSVAQMPHSTEPRPSDLLVR